MFLYLGHRLQNYKHYFDSHWSLTVAEIGPTQEVRWCRLCRLPNIRSENRPRPSLQSPCRPLSLCNHSNVQQGQSNGLLNFRLVGASSCCWRGTNNQTLACIQSSTSFPKFSCHSSFGETSDCQPADEHDDGKFQSLQHRSPVKAKVDPNSLMKQLLID